MMQRIFALLALLATASAFAPASTSTAFGVAKSATALMAQKAPEVASKNLMATLAGAVPVLLASTAAVATEGTGEWFGVDDTRLLLVLFIGHWFILTLWFQQYGKYDESEDFFGEIDYTTSKK